MISRLGIQPSEIEKLGMEQVTSLLQHLRGDGEEDNRYVTLPDMKALQKYMSCQ